MRNRGFALLSVLFALSAITLLMALSLERTSSHVQLMGYEARKHKAGLHAAAAIEQAGVLVVLEALPEDPDQWISIGDSETRTRIRDVAGLVDLNTAKLDLLAKLFESFDLPTERLVAQLAERRQARRDFLTRAAISELAAIPPERTEDLLPFVTVFSGRPGIYAAQAPLTLLERLAGRSGTRSDLSSALPAGWRSGPDGLIYALEIKTKSAGGRSQHAVIQASRGQQGRLVLHALQE